MTILGIDLGIGSIGWALIEIEEKTYAPVRIIGIGSRIVNLTTDETKAFTSANGETPCAKRTFNRSTRRMLLRWKQRRKYLQNFLHNLGMYDREDNLNTLPPLELWSLRAKAADPSCKLLLKELGRVILHLSTKRGYRHSRLDSTSEKEDTQYVAKINKHYSDLKKSGLTVGQYLYYRLRDSETTVPGGKGSIVTYRIKEGDPEYSNLFPREAHEEELSEILKVQSQHYPEILTNEVIDEIENIIFYQRPLKSCKNLVSRCEMFNFKFVNNNGKTIDCNPRVAPKTSPVSQLTRIWETVNNIRLINSKNKILNPNPTQRGLFTLDYRKTLEKFELSEEERRRVAEYLFTHEKLTATDLLKLLGLKRADGFKPETNIGKGIKGNKTYVDLYNALIKHPKRDELLRFRPTVNEIVDSETGEVRYVIDAGIINEPLYRLWHLIYSIPERDKLQTALTQQFGITDPEILDNLVKLDFKTAGFSNRSVKFMRRILPYLMKGDMYSIACEKAGFRHSDYLTKDENLLRPISTSITHLEKGSLRQPLVEKVLNQMINIVNDIIEKYGPIDEIRVELARELKQSKEQRIKASKDISANEKQNEKFAKLIEQHGIKVNRRTLQKYRMWEETEHRC
ncbi:MAG: type II CRISPR RNA-guided endonuclease Cas9, partial [Paramuribaculum sp.]|nr:type II CRISPR RNA-guided endonuclease Cas9 [Paramuribaculum sp.]